LFQYYVQRDDNILDLRHNGTNALQLMAGSSILHATSIPETVADLSLRDPDDFTLTKGFIVTPMNLLSLTHYLTGLVERQWKSRFPKKVEVLFRGLYHSRASSLSATLEHDGSFARIFENCCGSKTFGRSYPNYRFGNNNRTAINLDTGIGYSYFFSDSIAPNIAKLGKPPEASQLIILVCFNNSVL
jgi:hypothetical protein